MNLYLFKGSAAAVQDSRPGDWIALIKRSNSYFMIRYLSYWIAEYQYHKSKQTKSHTKFLNQAVALFCITINIINFQNFLNVPLWTQLTRPPFISSLFSVILYAFYPRWCKARKLDKVKLGKNEQNPTNIFLPTLSRDRTIIKSSPKINCVKFFLLYLVNIGERMSYI